MNRIFLFVVPGSYPIWNPLISEDVKREEGKQFIKLSSSTWRAAYGNRRTNTEAEDLPTGFHLADSPLLYELRVSRGHRLFYVHTSVDFVIKQTNS